MTRRVIALLGRRDEPTDAVEEYCRYLGNALLEQNVRLEVQRLPWNIHGWPASLEALRLQASNRADCWVLVQYTALAWSAHGFPLKFPRVLQILKATGARVAVVYHDVEPFPGSRPIDRLRHSLQIHTMRRAHSLSDLAIFTVPPEKLSWLPAFHPKARFIPVGANLPIPHSTQYPCAGHNPPTIGVFSITGGGGGAHETKTIVASLRYASQRLGRISLRVFGRHSELREDEIHKGLNDLPIEIFVEGVIDPAQVVENLLACDLLLFVRGPISSRRSSAIAGISCGLPVIGYRGSETAPPITDAGVILVPPEEKDAVGIALVQVLSDYHYRESLAARSRLAQEKYFSWSVLAKLYAEALQIEAIHCES